ncbi:MAG: tetratricopeptide repeat protein [Spirosomataceae bacterium]
MTQKPFLIILLIASALVLGLYSLPKGVLSNKEKEKAPQASAQPSSEPAASANNAESHAPTLTPDQQKQVTSARKQFEQATSKPDKAKASEQLITVFAQASRFDSAAYFAEVLVGLEPTLKNIVRAGDAYFGAFQFSMNDAKSAQLSQKAREFYQKALDQNPGLLEVKTNMAMTYVSTSTPMQGILLLREVLEQDPDFEPALFNLGMLSMQSNQFDKAAERFRQIVKNNPANTKALFYLGISLAELGKKAEARQALEEVARKDKDPNIQAAVKETLQKL